MKQILLILVLLGFLACKDKDDPQPEPPVPDYADSLVGTYLGTEIRFQQDNSTQEYNNGSKTMTVAKLGKNRIQVMSFTSGPMPIFNLSEGGSNGINLSPEGMNSGGFNKYILDIKQLNIKVTNAPGAGAASRYYYYQAIKQ